ncbi:hypothetical protein [Curtobacterium flaccumfaciens]|uniref:hypothetical protein n=1 Tax=Curtobacterium flaccumfaciens TaxID=2035 RepID=UPI001BDE4357|nr:hypothetical protein [Curtobacterium flaccumfaciens]MBT1631454.1 hypothetical protein [Curtobacterium flaccumfaciens pv. oortii]MCX2846762.1 hypothetical protein [Curtobacterium flaccumfaciens pv. oortii]
MNRSVGTERHVAALVLLDGAQLAALLTILPFLLFTGTTASGAAGAAPLAVGLAMGVVGTLAVGRLSDKVSPYGLLQSMQGLQIVVYALTLAAASTKSMVLLAVSAAASVALARSVGPAKDKIRAEHIGPDRRTSFNATTRRWFLVVNQVAVAVCTVGLTALPRLAWPLSLTLVIAVNLASLLMTQSLRRRQPGSTGNPAAHRPERLNSQQRLLLVWGLALIGVLGLGSALPTVGLTAWITRTHGYPPWIVSAVGVVVLAADFWFIKWVSEFVTSHPRWWATIHRFGSILLIAALATTVAGTQSRSSPVALSLIVLGMVLSALALSVSTLLAMEIQYGFGSPATRGWVASLTRTGSIAGTAAATALAPGIFLATWPLIACVTVLAVATLFVPTRLSRSLIDAAEPVR